MKKTECSFLWIGQQGVSTLGSSREYKAMVFVAHTGFQSRTVEDVSCISKNIAVVEAETSKSRKTTKRTYFADEYLNFENVFDSSPVQRQKQKK